MMHGIGWIRIWPPNGICCRKYRLARSTKSARWIGVISAITETLQGLSRKGYHDMGDGCYILQNQLHQLREFVEYFWTMFDDPRDGERKAYIERAALLDMFDEFGVELTD